MHHMDQVEHTCNWKSWSEQEKGRIVIINKDLNTESDNQGIGNRLKVNDRLI